MSEQEHLPFNVPTSVGSESAVVAEAIRNRHLSSGGPFSKEAADILQAELSAASVHLTTSCTDALEMAAILANVETGDKVIVPAFTFVSTALAFVRQGAEIIFADVDPHTLGVSAETIEPLMHDQVKAVVPVHYAGIPADIESLTSLVGEYSDCHLIEDNAHGLFGKVNGRVLGSFGTFSALSFHETKNFSCGEGGALVVNDEAFSERAQIMLDKGTNRQQFMQGQVDKYSWVDTGSSFGISDVLAALLVAQLRERTQILSKRRTAEETYRSLLAEPLRQRGIEMPGVANKEDRSAHLVCLLASSTAQRDQLLADLRAAAIQATFHYVPLHNSEAGLIHSSRAWECPVADDVSSRLIRLPFFTEITPSQIERVSTAVLESIDRTSN